MSDLLSALRAAWLAGAAHFHLVRYRQRARKAMPDPFTGA